MKKLVNHLPFFTNKKKVLHSLLSTVVFFALLGSLTFEATKLEVQLTTDGETQVIRTHASTIGELAKRLNLGVQEQDHLNPGLGAAIEPGMEINYESAKQITVTIDEDKSKQYYTTADTVQQFIQEEGLDIESRDQVSPSKGKKIQGGMSIDVKKAFQVTLHDGSKAKEVWTTADTVGEFLKQKDIKLNPLDKVEQKKDRRLVKNDSVRITRVEKVTDIVEESVDYTVVTKKDDSLRKGEKRILEEGKEGRLVKHYEVTLENGEEVKRELLKTETAQESQERVVAVGTKTIQQNVSRSSNDGSVVKELYMESTAYTAYCNGCSGVTNTGIDLRANPNRKVVAVDPDVIPLGSRVWVEGYGYAVAGDIGSAIQGNRIDVFIPNKSDASQYGRQHVKVKVLE